MSALIAAVMSWAAAGTAFESWTTTWASTAIGASATGVWTPTAAIRASATAIAATIPAAAAERPLEARAWVAANAGGIAREIFAWSGWTANAWSPSFAGEKNHIVFDDRRTSRDGFAGRSGEHLGLEMCLPFRLFRFRVFRVPVIGFCMFVLVSMPLLGMFVFTETGSVNGAVVRKVRFGLGAVHGTLLFHFFRFFGRKF